MKKVWFMSDPHYSHKNMCRGITAWDNSNNQCRDFDTIEQMNDTLINNINACVQQDDDLYCLGDWSFAGIDNIWNFRKRIICKNIYLIPGNHDDKIKSNKTLPNCSWYPGKSFIYDSMSYYQTGKNTSIGDAIVKAQDVFTKVLEQCSLIRIKGQDIVLSHYPLEQWENMDRGAWMLHGHVHGMFNDHPINKNNKRMDVGVDWKEYRPYSFEEIKKIMDKRVISKHEDLWK